MEEFTDSRLENNMYQTVFGNRNTGIHAIFYFDSEEEAKEFGEDERRYLRLLRRERKRHANKNLIEAKYIFNKYKDEKMLRNFLIRIQEIVDMEEEHATAWQDNGVFGSRY